MAKMAIYRGCEAWVIREGWEGLVRGNDDASSSGTSSPDPSASALHSKIPRHDSNKFSDAHNPHAKRAPNEASATAATAAGNAQPPESSSVKPSFVSTFGQGELLREGVGEAEEIGLKGKYIVRVGWDDVRGWMDQVSPWSSGLRASSARATPVLSHIARVRDALRRVALSSERLAARRLGKDQAGKRQLLTSSRAA